MWCLYPIVPISSHRIASLLVGEDEKNIRLGDGHVRSRFPYRLITLTLEIRDRVNPRHRTRSSSNPQMLYKVHLIFIRFALMCEQSGQETVYS